MQMRISEKLTRQLIRSAILFLTFSRAHTGTSLPSWLIGSRTRSERISKRSRVQRSMTPPQAMTSCEFSAHYLPIHGSTAHSCVWCPWQSSVWLRGSRCCCCTDMKRIRSIFEARDELFKRCSQFKFVSGEWKISSTFLFIFLLLPLPLASPFLDFEPKI